MQTQLAESAASTGAVSALAPTSYNLGVALGWKRFAISGDVAGVKDANSAIGGRESAIVGVSYSLKRFTGRVAVGAERSEGHPLPALRKGDRDIAITHTQQLRLPDVTLERFREDEFVVYCGSSHRLAQRKSVTLDDIAQERWAISAALPTSLVTKGSPAAHAS